jgi:hypothetical protein
MKMHEILVAGGGFVLKPALIQPKLLIFQYSKITKRETKANLSFRFHSDFSSSLSFPHYSIRCGIQTEPEFLESILL